MIYSGGVIAKAVLRLVKPLSAILLVLAALIAPLVPQGRDQKSPPAIEVPYKGLRYSMLSRGGVTVMIAPLDRAILEYSTAQVWVSNGSKSVVRVNPQAFSMSVETAGQSEPRTMPGTAEGTVLNEILKRARSHDVLELVRAYEATLFGFANEKSLNYYQQRKQHALASAGSGKMRAAATASAIILAEKVLRPGEVVDGTVFFRTEGKHLRVASLSARLAGAVFEFPQTPDSIRR